MEALDITIKDSCGAYVTNTYRGVRSSSTSSAKSAAEKQGDKLFGLRFLRVQHLHDISPGCSRWRLFHRPDPVQSGVVRPEEC